MKIYMAYTIRSLLISMIIHITLQTLVMEYMRYGGVVRLG